MDEKVFSVGQILGLVYQFQKPRSHKAEPGLDRFRLTFLLIVSSDSNALFVIKDWNIKGLLHMTLFKFLFRPYVSNRKGNAQFEKFVNLNDHVAKIVKRGGLLCLNNSLSIGEVNSNVCGNTEAKAITDILAIAKRRRCFQPEKPKYAIDRISKFRIVF